MQIRFSLSLFSLNNVLVSAGNTSHLRDETGSQGHSVTLSLYSAVTCPPSPPPPHPHTPPLGSCGTEQLVKPLTLDVDVPICRLLTSSVTAAAELAQRLQQRITVASVPLMCDTYKQLLNPDSKHRGGKMYHNHPAEIQPKAVSVCLRMSGCWCL